jgi:WD40 repeat protein
MASGSTDEKILVWDVGAGTYEKTLMGHADAVVALVACRQRLISSSLDKTVKVWSMATWSCMKMVQVYRLRSRVGSVHQVSGLTLVSGFRSSSLAEVCEAWV